MEWEADLRRGIKLGCFYSNLCKWVCLHLLQDSLWIEVTDVQLYRTMGARVWFTVPVLHLAVMEVCEKDTVNKEKETGMCIRPGKAFWYNTLQYVVQSYSTTVGLAVVMRTRHCCEMTDRLKACDRFSFLGVPSGWEERKGGWNVLLNRSKTWRKKPAIKH